MACEITRDKVTSLERRDLGDREVKTVEHNPVIAATWNTLANTGKFVASALYIVLYSSC